MEPEKIVVIVFDSEVKAHEGIKKLKRLDADGSITVNQGVLLRRNKEGEITTDTTALAEFPVRTVAGTALGALVGMLGGPAGVTAGAAVGATAGLAADAVIASLDDDFITQAASSLKPGTAVVVLDLSEEWITPLDAELETYARSILRRPKVDVEDDLLAKRAEANDRELSELEQELKTAASERKAKLQARIDELKGRMRNQVARFAERRKQVEAERQAKRAALEQKVSTATSNVRKGIQSRLDALEHADQEASARVDKSFAEKLRRIADHIERKAS